MHPILLRPSRLATYLAAWAFLTGLLVMALQPRGVSLAAAALLLFPPSFVYAFICLAAWYPVRATPAGKTAPGRLIATHAVGAVVSSGVWVLLAIGWGRGIGHWPVMDGAARAFREEMRFLFGMGVALYLLAVAVHSLILALEMSQAVERRELSLEVLAREAELKTLRDQVNPHFLFNSLNSISALCGSSPATARTMAVVLSEFLRKSLRVGSEEMIALSDEIELASSYLAVERIRFGDRLQLEQHVDEEARTCRIPPLLVQPLVENAVTHGISHLVGGGVVRLDVRKNAGRLTVTVENDCDPDRPRRTGGGIGLRNVRQRIEHAYGREGAIDVTERAKQFRVAISVPA